MSPGQSRPSAGAPVGRAIRAYLVHLYTASGVVFAFLATAQIAADRPDPRWIFLWLALAGVVDSTDGPLARAWDVKTYAPRIRGRTMDDIVDYLTYTFVPLLLVWRMDWLAPPAGLWVVLAMLASLFGFSHTAAKQEHTAFFQGFPSYWNVVAFYLGPWRVSYGPSVPTAVVVLLAAATLLPVRFIYPNLAPGWCRRLLYVGGVLWLVTVLLLLPSYPFGPTWLTALSLLYPALYVVVSLYLDLRSR